MLVRALRRVTFTRRGGVFDDGGLREEVGGGGSWSLGESSGDL